MKKKKNMFYLAVFVFGLLLTLFVIIIPRFGSLYKFFF